MFKIMDVKRTKVKGKLRTVVSFNGKVKTMKCGQYIDSDHYISSISLCEQRNEKEAIVTNEKTKEEKEFSFNNQQ